VKILGAENWLDTSKSCDEARGQQGSRAQKKSVGGGGGVRADSKMPLRKKRSYERPSRTSAGWQ